MQSNLINKSRNLALRLDMKFRKRLCSGEHLENSSTFESMLLHTILRFLHIICFASWFGTILASIFLLKALESKLTYNDNYNAEYSALLQRFLKLETKVADVAVIGVIISGILLAALYHGWTIWVVVKSLLIVLQIVLTISYIMRSVRPISYPCSKSEYGNWYRLFAISLIMFLLVLVITFFFSEGSGSTQIHSVI